MGATSSRSPFLLPLVAVATALLGAAPGAAAAPDLAVTGLRLDAQNRLLVTITNHGDATVPAGVGSLSIAIDGKPVGSYALGNLADQSFRTPGGSLTIPTNFRLAGGLRQVLAVVDPGGAIAESNEHQNLRSRSLLPSPSAGVDLTPDLLYRDSSGLLRFRVRNLGNQAPASPFPAVARVIVGGTVVADLALDLGGLAAGGSRWISPAPAIAVPNPGRVRVLLTTPSFLAELDSTNNVREQWLPTPPGMAEFDRLVALPEVRDAIRWNGSPYGSWSSTMRAALRTAFLRLENGDPAGPAAPPATSDGTISELDAQAIFLARVAHTLRVEAHHLVPWSLLELAAGERALLLDSIHVVSRIWGSGTPPRYAFDPFRAGALTDWNSPASFRFLAAVGLIRSTPESTLLAVADWMRAHLVHELAGFDPTEAFAYDGKPPVDRVIYPLLDTYWTQGCSGTTYLFRALLHAVNVPVELNDPSDAYGHRRPIFPSLGLAMAHADDVYSRTMTPAGRPVPIGLVFDGVAEIEERFLTPPLDCADGRCNTPAEQYAYNLNRIQLAYSWIYLGDYLLDRYGLDGPEGLEAELTGDLTRQVRPFFTPDEIAMMRLRVEAELDRLGAGDRAAGIEIVRRRMNRWALNKLPR